MLDAEQLEDRTCPADPFPYYTPTIDLSIFFKPQVSNVDLSIFFKPQVSNVDLSIFFKPQVSNVDLSIFFKPQVSNVDLSIFNQENTHIDLPQQIPQPVMLQQIIPMFQPFQQIEIFSVPIRQENSILVTKSVELTQEFDWEDFSMPSKAFNETLYQK